MLELIGVVLDGPGPGRLDRCSFEAQAGEVLGLVGPNGAGKSAALSVAAGAVRPSRGRIQLAGRDVSRQPARLRAAAAWSREHLDGPFDISAQAWLRWWADLDGVPADTRDATLDAVCTRFGVTWPDTLVGQLSRGQQRRLSLARAWTRSVKLRLLDAPADGLDGDGLRRLTQAIRDAAAAGETIVLADAAPHLVVTVCDRVVLMREGTARAVIGRSDEGFAERIARHLGWAS